MIALSSSRFIAFATAESPTTGNSGIAAGPSENFDDGLPVHYEAQPSVAHRPTMTTAAASQQRSYFSVQGARRLSETFLSSAASTAASRGLLSRSAPSANDARAARPAQASTFKSTSPRNHVKVLDLHTLRTVCHFRPYRDKSIVLLSFSPDGRQLLTSCTDGQAFHIFELRFPSPSSSRSLNRCCAWHRYRLTRGLTIAKAVGASWSTDGRFVAVSTDKGTTHVFAISPAGGKATVLSHTNPHITNIETHQPLSENVAPIARLRPWRDLQAEAVAADGKPNESAALLSSNIAPAVLFPSYADYLSMLSQRTNGALHAASAGKLHANIAIYHASSQRLQLSRITMSEYVPSLSMKVASSGTKVAMSGLSQMLRGHHGRSVSGMKTEEAPPELAATPMDLAYYRLGDSNNYEVPSVAFSLALTDQAHDRCAPTAADIHTHSYATAIMTRSIYLSPAYSFYAYPPRNSVQPAFKAGRYEIPTIKRIRVRDEVAHTHRLPLDEVQESDELQTAMHSGLEVQALRELAENDAAAFPNGYGRPSLSLSNRHWRDVRSLAHGLRSIPIPAAAARSASSALARSLDGIRGLSGMRSPPVPQATIDATYNPPVVLSFEADDAVFPNVNDYPESPQVDEDPVVLAAARRRKPVASIGSPAAPTTAGRSIDIPQPARTASSFRDASGTADVHAATLPSVSSASHSIPGMTHASSSDSPLSMPLTTPEVTSADEDAVGLAAADDVEVEDEWAAWKLDGIDDLTEPGAGDAGQSGKQADAHCESVSVKEELLGLPQLLGTASLGTSPVSLSSSPASLGTRKSNKKKSKSKR